MQQTAHCYDDVNCLKSLLAPIGFGTRYIRECATCVLSDYGTPIVNCTL